MLYFLAFEKVQPSFNDQGFMNFRTFISGSIFGVVITIAALFARDPILNLISSLSPETAAQTATLSVPKSAPTMGQTGAPLMIVEFTDFQCPYCKVFQSDVMPMIKQDWIETGKLQFVHMDLPLEFHASAMPSAVAARCAGDQGKYWELHDAMFEKSDCLVCKGPEEIAREVGVDITALKICRYANRHADEIKADIDLAKSLQFSGTPTFVLGRVVDGILTGEVISGALPLDEFKKKLDTAFNQK